MKESVITDSLGRVVPAGVGPATYKHLELNVETRTWALMAARKPSTPRLLAKSRLPQRRRGSDETKKTSGGRGCVSRFCEPHYRFVARRIASHRT